MEAVGLTLVGIGVASLLLVYPVIYVHDWWLGRKQGFRRTR